MRAGSRTPKMSEVLCSFFVLHSRGLKCYRHKGFDILLTWKHRCKGRKFFNFITPYRIVTRLNAKILNLNIGMVFPYAVLML